MSNPFLLSLVSGMPVELPRSNGFRRGVLSELDHLKGKMFSIPGRW